MRPLLGGALMLVAAWVMWLGPYSAASAGRFGDRVLVGHYLTWYLLGPMLSRLGALATPLLAFLPWILFLVAAPVWWRQSPSTDRRRLLAWTATLWVLAAYGCWRPSPVTRGPGICCPSSRAWRC